MKDLKRLFNDYANKDKLGKKILNSIIDYRKFLSFGLITQKKFLRIKNLVIIY